MALRKMTEGLKKRGRPGILRATNKNRLGQTGHFDVMQTVYLRECSEAYMRFISPPTLLYQSCHVGGQYLWAAAGVSVVPYMLRR